MPRPGRKNEASPSLCESSANLPLPPCTAWLSQPIPQQPPAAGAGSEAVPGHPHHQVRPQSQGALSTRTGPVLQDLNSVKRSVTISVSCCHITRQEAHTAHKSKAQLKVSVGLGWPGCRDIRQPSFVPSKCEPFTGWLWPELWVWSLRESPVDKSKQAVFCLCRFEMPYNIWCDGCKNHIGMGEFPPPPAPRPPSPPIQSHRH